MSFDAESLVGAALTDFSKQRAAEIKKQLVEREKVEAARIEVMGRGWEEPLKTLDESRRVEAQWFTLE